MEWWEGVGSGEGWETSWFEMGALVVGGMNV